MEAVPVIGREAERLRAIPGTVPAPGAFPSGCRFHPRCPKAQAECKTQMPQLLEVEPGHWVRCPLWNK